MEEGKKAKEGEGRKAEFGSISDRYKGSKFHEMEKGGLGSFGGKQKEKKQSV